MVRAATSKEIAIPAIQLETVVFKVVGDTPLIMSAWSEKNKQVLLDKMMGKAKTKAREEKDPVKEFINSMYWMEGKPDEYTEEAFNKVIASGEAKFGFKATGFKAAAISAGYRSKITKDKVSVAAAFHINGPYFGGEFVEIIGTPRMREDIVRVSNGQPDIHYRGEFLEWIALLPVTFNVGVINRERVANLINLGGFACGVGEWRVEKGGSNGMYHIE